MGIIENIGQLEQCNRIFKFFNIIIVGAFSLLILYESNVSIPDIFYKIASNFDFLYKKGDSELQIKHIDNSLHRNEISKIAKEVKEEAKEQIIKGGIKQDNKCENCEVKEIISERESLRYFSAYQVTNKHSRDLLQFVRSNNKIKIEIFEHSMKEYYNKTIRNMGKKRKEEFISKKVEEVLYNLRYLNIIGYTEDGNFIILTQNGEEFVKGYNNEEVG